MIIVHTQEKQRIRQVRPPGMTAFYGAVAGTSSRLTAVHLTAATARRRTAAAWGSALFAPLSNARSPLLLLACKSPKQSHRVLSIL